MSFRSPRQRLTGVGVALVALALMLAVVHAEAAPIGIRVGRVTADWQGPVFFQFSAPDFFVTGQLDGGTFDAWACRPCAPGSIVGTSGFVSGTTMDGRAIVNGVPYDNLRFDVSFQFESQPVQMPTAPDVTAYLPGLPFQFRGTLRAEPWEGGGAPLFAQDVFGGGLAYTIFVRSRAGDGQLVWNFASFRYEFDADTLPEPIPEPATLALLASGVAGIGVRRWRGRRP